MAFNGSCRHSDGCCQFNNLSANVMLKARFWQRYAQTTLKERQSKIINRLLEAGPSGFENGLTNRKYEGFKSLIALSSV